MSKIKTQTVLIIDDNVVNLKIIATYLVENNFRVLTAMNGENGLNRAKLGQPDIILLDVMMPGIDGYETCNQLKKIEATKETPVIFMTSLSDTEYKIKGFEVGAVDYITKPIQQPEVLARLNTHLNLRNLTRELQTANGNLTQLSQELQDTNQMLIQLNADKDKFFSIVAHDLKSPFLPVLGNAKRLSDTAESLDTKEIIDISNSIYRSASHVIDFLENLLNWSQIQVGRMECTPIRINLHALIEQNINLLSANAANKMITVQNQVAEDIYVRADENMLNIVVRNLISNAIKFTNTDGLVIISTASKFIDSSPSFVEVSVTDNGIGMPQDIIDMLFRIDVRHNALGTAQERGTGLGLTMCKDMIDMNGGKIWIESQSGEGTTVKFSVPSDYTI